MATHYTTYDSSDTQAAGCGHAHSDREDAQGCADKQVTASGGVINRTVYACSRSDVQPGGKYAPLWSKSASDKSAIYNGFPLWMHDRAAFGKHSTKSWATLATEHPSYLRWLRDSCTASSKRMRAMKRRAKTALYWIAGGITTNGPNTSGSATTPTPGGVDPQAEPEPQTPCSVCNGAGMVAGCPACGKQSGAVAPSDPGSLAEPGYTIDASRSKKELVEAILAGIGDDVDVEAITKTAVEAAKAVADRTVTEKIEAEINAGRIGRTETVITYNPEKVSVVLPKNKRTHPKLKRVLELAKARKNILLIGPAGCGKTHLADQVAKLLNLPFFSTSVTAGMSEGVLLGRLLPIGAAGKFEYVVSQFLRAFEGGGVFLLDEFDAADPNVLLVINSAIANGYCDVPTRPDNPRAERHKDFVIIASANTFGTGANRLYVGRNRIDESTLDRFRLGQVEMDYDRQLEAELCGHDTELLARIWNVRDKADEASLRRLVSMRFSIDAAEMRRACDWSVDDCIDQLTAGWSDDELTAVGAKAA